MKPLDSEPLKNLPVSGLSRVRDLIYFDGPLLTQYVNARGENFLYYWCERDRHSHRWMLIRVDEPTILRLLYRFIPLDFVIPAGSQDDFVYFVDVTSGGRISDVWLTKVESIPEDYTPVRGTFLQDVPRNKKTGYPVLIEGKWEPSDLMGFPRLFELTYSFLYVANKLPSSGCFGGFHWRGGYAAMHFNRLIASIPTESRFDVRAVQYNSPGFFRFSADYDIAELVAISVEDVRKKRTQKRFRELSKYIASHHLNDIVDPDSDEWGEHKSNLLAMTRALAESFRAIDPDNVIAGAERAFEAAQIVRWFFRRISEIESYEESGLVKFAPIEEQAP